MSIESTNLNNMSMKSHFFDMFAKHVDLIDIELPAAGVS